MARAPSKFTDDRESWVGARIRHRPSNEYGWVTCAHSGKAPACFVRYDRDSEPRFAYISDLEKME